MQPRRVCPPPTDSDWITIAAAPKRMRFQEIKPLLLDHGMLSCRRKRHHILTDRSSHGAPRYVGRFHWAHAEAIHQSIRTDGGGRAKETKQARQTDEGSPHGGVGGDNKPGTRIPRIIFTSLTGGHGYPRDVHIYRTSSPSNLEHGSHSSGSTPPDFCTFPTLRDNCRLGDRSRSPLPWGVVYHLVLFWIVGLSAPALSQ